MGRRPWAAVVMGGSAGSLEALSIILPELPGNFPLPILAVVHIPADKKSILAEVLQRKCQVSVREAEDKEPLNAGTVYFAPPDYHLLVEADGHVALSYDEPLLYSRPSIDVLFESAADVYGANLIGIVLSGANSDGAQGLQVVEREGGAALVQAPVRAYSQEMPLAAIRACQAAVVLTAEEIAQFLKDECL